MRDYSSRHRSGDANQLVPFVCLVAAIGFSTLRPLRPAYGTEFAISNQQDLNQAMRDCQAGDRLLLDSGEYRGGISRRGLNGTAASPVVIESRDAKRPAVIKGGNTALHFSNCSYLTIRGIHVTDCVGNGINIDDGGVKDMPSHHISLENIVIENTGPNGNHDGLKVSGVRDFHVLNCQVRGWGGSGIDMVGCHAGVIRGCEFEGKEGFSQSNAVQIKGGSSNILVDACLFLHAGQRGINIGGSTGLEFFRPRVGAFEASQVEIRNCRFVGGQAPIAWVNANGGLVHHNTIYHPQKWVARILQENRTEGFLESRGGVFEDNVIVYDARVQIVVNVGDRTAPETFAFRRNAWYQSDASSNRQRQPQLPTPDENGLYGVDPKLENAGKAGMRVTNPALQGKGAQ